MLVTPLFTAIFALIYVALSFSVIRIRFTRKISLGDGEERQLLKAIRTHANFIEYVPLSLILMWFLETSLYDSRLVTLLGSVLLLARIFHIVGMKNPKQYLILRQIGILATFGVIIAASVRLIILYIPVEYLSVFS